MTSKMAQDSPTWLKIANDMPPRGSKTASRRLQEAKEPPKEAPKRQKSFQNLKKMYVFCLLAYSLPMAFRGLKMAPRWPKISQDSLRHASKRPQDGPRFQVPSEPSKDPPKRRK